MTSNEEPRVTITLTQSQLKAMTALVAAGYDILQAIEGRYTRSAQIMNSVRKVLDEAAGGVDDEMVLDRMSGTDGTPRDKRRSESA